MSFAVQMITEDGWAGKLVGPFATSDDATAWADAQADIGHVRELVAPRPADTDATPDNPEGGTP